MGNLSFRDLRADEVECRVAQATEKGVSLLLYKDARCDMIVLDETVGAFNWKRQHDRDNANCTVSIWDEEKQQWISKEDTGTESNTEAAKGLASDSFKRACFNWGIGRELYTAPFIWVSASNCKVDQKGGRWVCYDKFAVSEMSIKDKKIVGLAIINLSTKQTVYTYGKVEAQAPAKATTKKVDHRALLREFCKENGINTADIVKVCELNQYSTDRAFAEALEYAKTLVH